MKEIEDAIEVGEDHLRDTIKEKDLVIIRPALRATAEAMTLQCTKKDSNCTLRCKEAKAEGYKEGYKQGHGEGYVQGELAGELRELEKGKAEGRAELLKELKHEKKKYPNIGYSIVIENKLKELKAKWGKK